MLPVITAAEWQARVSAEPRPGESAILAFYEHRIGAICREPRHMLLPLDDHLVHRGDGAFETIRFSEGKMFNLQAHIARLEHSCSGLRIAPPCPWDTVRDIVLDVARAGNQPEGSVRVLLGRGPGGFDIDPAECPVSSLYVIAYKGNLHSDEWYATGLAACRSEVPVRPSTFARLKTANYLPGVLMTMEAHDKGADIAFSFDAECHLAEAAIANVALVDSAGTLIIPQCGNALPGTTVKKAADMAAPFMPVVHRPVDEAELFCASEVLVLGTAHECVGVRTYEGQPIGAGRPGPVAHKLRALIRADLLAGATDFMGRG